MEKEIKKAIETLRSNGLLLYPTDTVWGIGCDATSIAAVQKVYALKQRAASKALICLVADYTMLQDYIKHSPPNLKEILERQTKPTTVIYLHPRGIASNLVAQNDSLAIRICHHPFCQKLIRDFGSPIVSTSANISGAPTAKTFGQITSKIKKGVDYIVNLPDESGSNAEPSKIIKIEEDGSIKTIRE